MSRHDNDTFAAKLKQARKAKGISQNALAQEVARITGGTVSSTDISRYENAKVKSPNLDRIAAFAQALDVPLSYFTGTADQADRLDAIEELLSRLWAAHEQTTDLAGRLARLEARVDVAGEAVTQALEGMTKQLRSLEAAVASRPRKAAR